MTSTATPSITPMTEITVTTEINVRLGRMYFSARYMENGSRTFRFAALIVGIK
jgi:hypothetical protein